MHVIVVGSGSLGCVSALLAARRGWQVTLVEERTELWIEASAINEGKVHLGPVFALGDAATHRVMLDGALAFAPVIEEALGTRPPWEEWVTAPFEYLVMADSMASPAELATRYAPMNDALARRSAAERSNYLGSPLDRIIETAPHVHGPSGLPAFATFERAVDPLRLRAALVEEVERNDLIEVHTGTRAEKLADEGGIASVSVTGPDGERRELRGDAVINATWRTQAALVPHDRPQRNIRIKAAVRVGTVPGAPTVTIVQGPYGDVVPHRDYIYASWYPAARLSNEHGIEPSPASLQRMADFVADPASASAQLAPLHELGLLPSPELLDVNEVVAGVIIGHGPLDIDDHKSGLHARSEFGVRVDGRILSPLSFKLTTAPLAAARTIDAIPLPEGHTTQ